MYRREKNLPIRSKEEEEKKEERHNDRPTTVSNKCEVEHGKWKVMFSDTLLFLRFPFPV